MKKAFVVGHPIKHSRSPLIHGYWLKRYGINGSYERIDVAPADLDEFLVASWAMGFVGGNVTIPHKEATFAFLDNDNRTERARRVGAVNTLWYDEKGIELWGDNTDVTGFMAHLDASLGTGWEQDVETVLVLGAGGAARAVVAGLQDRPCKRIFVANRTLSKAEDLVRDLRPGSSVGLETCVWEAIPRVIPHAQLIVNTTSLGMTGQPPLDLDLSRAPRNAAVADIVYVPLETPLLAAAAAHGLRKVDGLGMLLHQAVPGFRRWFGVTPEVTPELRALILADIEGHPMTFVLGLTGSIGMGKSATADLFRRLGVPVHDADATVHRLYRGRAAPLIEKNFPGTVADGAVDRVKLGAAVLNNPERMKQLEAIVHPLVREEEEGFLARVSALSPVAVLDIPLLFETRGETRCDAVLVVTAPSSVQRDRVMSRPGMTEEKFHAILAKQMPDADKRARAHFLVDTSRGFASAEAQVRSILACLAGRPGRRHYF